MSKNLLLTSKKRKQIIQQKSRPNILWWRPLSFSLVIRTPSFGWAQCCPARRWYLPGQQAVSKSAMCGFGEVASRPWQGLGGVVCPFLSFPHLGLWGQRSHRRITRMECWRNQGPSQLCGASLSPLDCLPRKPLLSWLVLPWATSDLQSWDLHSCRPFGGAWGGCGGIPACSSAPSGWTASGFHCCSFHLPAQCWSFDTYRCLWSKAEHGRVKRSYAGFSQVRAVYVWDVVAAGPLGYKLVLTGNLPHQWTRRPLRWCDLKSSKVWCLRAQALESDTWGPKSCLHTYCYVTWGRLLKLSLSFFVCDLKTVILSL